MTALDIAAIRADERERVAQAIEREREMRRPNAHPLTLIALDVAAVIARGGPAA